MAEISIGVFLRDSLSQWSQSSPSWLSWMPEYFCLVPWTLGSQVDIVPAWLLMWTLRIWTLVLTCSRSALPAAPAPCVWFASSAALLLSSVSECSPVVTGRLYVKCRGKFLTWDDSRYFSVSAFKHNSIYLEHNFILSSHWLFFWNVVSVIVFGTGTQ